MSSLVAVLIVFVLGVTAERIRWHFKTRELRKLALRADDYNRLALWVQAYAEVCQQEAESRLKLETILATGESLAYTCVAEDLVRHLLRIGLPKHAAPARPRRLRSEIPPPPPPRAA